MATIVSQMTVSELRDLIGDVFEEKLSALLTDEDNLEFTDELNEILARQDREMKEGELGEPFEQVLTRLGFD